MLVAVLKSCLMYAGSHLEAAQEAARERAAARVALLAMTILTALNVHTQTDKDPKIKPLLSAAWRVSPPKSASKASTACGLLLVMSGGFHHDRREASTLLFFLDSSLRQPCG